MKTKAALRRLPPGGLLDVACTDPLSNLDIPNLVREEGDELVAQESGAGVFMFRIRRAARAGGCG